MKTATTKLQRARILKLITPMIRRFARRGDASDVLFIDDMLGVGVGWISNFTGRSFENKTRTLLVLLPLASDADLEHVADATICRRERAKGHDAADETARRILAPLGVRYAACGCLERFAGDLCCDNAVTTRAA